MEVSDKVQIQTSTGNEKEESGRPDDKLINDKEVESSYQGKKALHTDSISEAEIHHGLGSSYTNANKTSSSKEEIDNINKTELPESISEIISILKEEYNLGETITDSNMQRGQQEEKLGKPKSKLDEVPTSKGIFTTGNHNHRTIENYSTLTEVNHYARKQKEYSHDDSDMAQEEGTRKQFKNQTTVRNAEWKDVTNCQEKETKIMKLC